MGELAEYGGCDVDPCSFYTEKRVKARKAHVCCETGVAINPGDHYWVCRLGFDGTVSAHKQSESAYHLCRFINLKLIGECSIAFGELGDFVTNLAGNRWAEPLESMYREIREGKLRLASDEVASEIAYARLEEIERCSE